MSSTKADEVLNMDNSEEQLKGLLIKLEAVSRKQDEFQREISLLKILIQNVKENIQKENDASAVQRVQDKEPEAVSTQADVKEHISTARSRSDAERKVQIKRSDSNDSTAYERLSNGSSQSEKLSDFERFIGENLINKVGILIIIIGVVFGVRYAINHELISELGRIILAYVLGAGLMGTALGLRKKYPSYSGVLLSGAMAIMYFTSFVAYSLYDIIPQTATFVIMVGLTVATVIASLNYDHSVIAHIGLVGAYAIPYLLSDNDSNPEILFSYVAIINSGILFISFKKQWISLSYSAFVFTWLIYLTWYALDYGFEGSIITGLLFVTLFFFLFYLTFIANKFKTQGRLIIGEVLALLFNSFIFYGIGFSLLYESSSASQFLGLFTLLNAVIHFSIGILLRKRKMTDPGLYHFVTGLVLVFLTLSIPVQLDGNWVTLLWVMEATLLFWVGRNKKQVIYEYLSFPLMAIALLSIVQDYGNAYDVAHLVHDEFIILPLLNINFLSSLIFIGCFVWILRIQLSSSEREKELYTPSVYQFLRVAIPSVLLIVSYSAFFVEIASYWDQLRELSAIEDSSTSGYKVYNEDHNSFKELWLLNYSIAFLALLNYLRIKWQKSLEFSMVLLGLLVLSIALFLAQGLQPLSELTSSFIYRAEDVYFSHGTFNLIMRYISLSFLTLGLLSMIRVSKQKGFPSKIIVPVELFKHFVILWILSTELAQWMDLFDRSEALSISLSILWGAYSLYLIFYGMAKKKKYLRVGAIILFGLTLSKLVLFDLSHLDTVSKTIVFIALGILLLIISFLYNRYKDALSAEEN